MHMLHSGNTAKVYGIRGLPRLYARYQINARFAGTSRTGDMMSAIDTNRVHGGTRSFGTFGIGSKLLAAIAAWNDARVTRNALSRLSDRELDDIGLSRGDIDRIARAR